MEKMTSSEENSSCEEITLLSRPIPVVLVNDENHTFELDENAISSILLQKNVLNLPVVVISVAGAFRKGKSFLLNFFLRYLTAKEVSYW